MSKYTEQALAKAKAIKEDAQRALDKAMELERKNKAERMALYNNLLEELREFAKLPLTEARSLQVTNPLAVSYEIEVEILNPFTNNQKLFTVTVTLEKTIKTHNQTFNNVESFMNYFIESIVSFLKV